MRVGRMKSRQPSISISVYARTDRYRTVLATNDARDGPFESCFSASLKLCIGKSRACEADFG